MGALGVLLFTPFWVNHHLANASHHVHHQQSLDLAESRGHEHHSDHGHHHHHEPNHHSDTTQDHGPEPDHRPHPAQDHELASVSPARIYLIQALPGITLALGLLQIDLETETWPWPKNQRPGHSEPYRLSQPRAPPRFVI